MSTLPVSVVISVLNEGTRLAHTVESILSGSSLPAEVLVVDDGSTDGCTAALTTADRTGGHNVHVVRRPHEGIAGARNYGLSTASQPTIVYLDAHCVVRPDWLEPLVRTLDASPHSIVVPTIGDVDRPDDRGCGARLINDLLAYQWVTTDPAPDEVGIAPGGCFAVRRELLHEIGGFAAMRDFGLEDVELSLRAWRFGVPIRTAPESLILHQFRQTAPYPMLRDRWMANMLLTALLHLDHERLDRTLQAAAGLGSFPKAIRSVLTTDWIDRKRWIDAQSVRSLDSYWDAYGANTHKRAPVVSA